MTIGAPSRAEAPESPSSGAASRVRGTGARLALLSAIMAISGATLHEAPATWSRPAMQPCGDVGADDNPCWTAPHIPDEVYAARFAGDYEPTWICDGDVIRNSGARDGVAFRTGPQVVSFDRAHLRSLGIAHRIEGARACIPARDYGQGWVEAEACGNAILMIRRASAAALILHPEYMRGGPPSVGPRTGGGASAHVAAPLLPAVIVNPAAPVYPVGPTQPPAPAPVDLPMPLALMLGALAFLGALAVRRRA